MILKTKEHGSYRYEVIQYSKQLVPKSDDKETKTSLGYARNLKIIIKELEDMIADGGCDPTVTKYVISDGGTKKHEVHGMAYSARIAGQEKIWFEKLAGEFSQEGVSLSPWIIDEHCCFRYLVGANPNDPQYRIAFIEKTPRIRYKMFGGGSTKKFSYIQDGGNWYSGPKGSGGCGDPKEEENYGFYPPSRQWCDEMLTKMGYKLDSSDDIELSSIKDEYTDEIL